MDRFNLHRQKSALGEKGLKVSYSLHMYVRTPVSLLCPRSWMGILLFGCAFMSASVTLFDACHIL